MILGWRTFLSEWKFEFSGSQECDPCELEIEITSTSEQHFMALLLAHPEDTEDREHGMQ